MFENEHDIRMFLSRLARAVRAGLLEVHAYCVLTTHFHLLVRSPNGELSAALQQIQNEYVRWFNRGRRRDGPLVRGRFFSKLVDSHSYRCNVLRYIDFNPVSARLVAAPALYPHGSAQWYSRHHGPPWLSRGWVEDLVREWSGRQHFDPADYTECMGASLSESVRRFVERRLASHRDSADPLDQLLASAAPGVREWMVSKAALADGTELGSILCDPDDVSEVLTSAGRGREEWLAGTSRKSVDAWQVAQVGLLRDLCGATLQEAAERAATNLSGAWRMQHAHQRLLRDDEEYAGRVSELATHALRRCHAVTVKQSRAVPLRRGSSPPSLAAVE